MAQKGNILAFSINGFYNSLNVIILPPPQILA